MNESRGAREPGMASLRRRWFGDLRREGLVIVTVVAFVTSLNATTKFLVTVSLVEWFENFAIEFASYLFVGSAMLLGAVRARHSFPRRTVWQYLAVGAAVVATATLAEGCIEAWDLYATGLPDGWRWWHFPKLVGSQVVRDSSIGLIIASAWLYVRAEAEHAAAIAACAVDVERMDRETAEARLQMLEAQIEPHFLFNTLANVRRLYETDPAAGARMMRNLKQYLSVALPQMRAASSSLGKEADHAIAYLNIQQIRMGRRLAFAFDVPQELRAARMPPLMLLTLVENAIKHGLSPLPEGGRIDVRARLEEGRLRIEVADTGQGFATSGGGGTGLANTRARLASHFGERASLLLANNVPQGVVFTLLLPCEIGAAAGAGHA